MAAKTLAQLRDLVEGDLTDAGNATWSTDEIDRGIRRALFRYSEVRPQQVIGTLTAAASREYSLATLTGLVDVQRVWYPYLSTDPVYPPAFVEFELWDDKTVLFIHTEDCPAVGDDPLRVFYTKAHTLNGLDSETTSTYYVEDEEVLVLGATAFAAIQRTRYVVDTVNPSVETPGNWKAWGTARMREFEQELKRVGLKVSRHFDSRVAMDLDV